MVGTERPESGKMAGCRADVGQFSLELWGLMCYNRLCEELKSVLNRLVVR